VGSGGRQEAEEAEGGDQPLQAVGAPDRVKSLRLPVVEQGDEAVKVDAVDLAEAFRSRPDQVSSWR